MQRTHTRHSGFWFDIISGLDILILIFVHYFNLLALLYLSFTQNARFAQTNSQELVAGTLRTILGRPQLSLTHTLHSQRVTQTLPLSHPTHNHTASTSRETTHLQRFPFL